MGSSAKLDRAYLDEQAAQAICLWAAPDRGSVEDVFKKAGVVPESVREVKVHCG